MNDDPGKNIKYQDFDKKIESMIDETDRRMLSYIARLYQAVHGEKLDFTKIQSAVEALQQFNSRNELTYLNNLLHPEKCKGVKIPSQVPVPSCSFQLHNCITLSTNSSGNLAVVFNPYFLASNLHSTGGLLHVTEGQRTTDVTSKIYSSLFVNNDNTLNGYSYNENWRLINIGQEIPPVYDQYRLVSASLVIKYIGRLDTVSGVIGGAIVFDETPEIGAEYTIHTDDGQGGIVDTDEVYIPKNLAKYGNFDLAMDAFYRQENLCLEGIRQLYFPIDNSYEEYTRLFNDKLVYAKLDDLGRTTYNLSSTEDYLKNGFRQVVYVLGAPANQSCFKLDIYCNFECLPSSPFLNYLPLSMTTDYTPLETKRQATIVVQQKPVMKSNEGVENNEVAAPSIWDKMKNKFMDSLPGMGKLIASGLVQAIPQLQLGTSLSNTMSVIGNSIANNIANQPPNP